MKESKECASEGRVDHLTRRRHYIPEVGVLVMQLNEVFMTPLEDDHGSMMIMLLVKRLNRFSIGHES